MCHHAPLGVRFQLEHVFSHRLPNPAPNTVGVFETGTDGEVLFVSEAWEKLTGVAIGTDVGARWLAAIHDDDRAWVLAEWETALTDGTPISLEYRLARDDQESRLIRMHAYPVSEAIEGGVPRYIGTFMDISGSRDAAEELRDIEERFWKSFENAPIGIALVALNGDWLRVNRSLSAMLGYTEAELMGRTFQDITHPDDIDADVDNVRRMIAGELRTYEMEKRYVRADGKVIWALLAVSMVHDSGGSPAYFVSQVQDITERRRHERELRYLAAHDVLTGLANRRQLAAEVDRLFATRRLAGGDFSLVLLDLDHFKYINDTLGHKAGDDVLRAVAGEIQKTLRDEDMVARLGGDEFACLLPRSDEVMAGAVAMRLLERIRALDIPVGDRRLQVSASAGVACTATGGLEDEDGLLAAADLAMYEAKDDGRDRHATHAVGDINRHRATARLNWNNRIRKALENDSFVVNYQPILDLRDPSARRAEALIRLADEPGSGLVLPGSFIYIAERFGLMPSIDRWIFEKVFSSMASGAIPEDAEIAINISGRSMLDEALLDHVRGLLDRLDIDPQRICFEVTETAAISKLEVAQKFAIEVSELGCGFALDDFGTGFASFSQLKHLPYGFLKIDGDFVRNATASAQDRAVIEALVHVAATTNKRTIAEYVGDRATLDLLVDLGVDMAQGFFISEPVQIERLPAVWDSLPGLAAPTRAT